MTDTTHHQDRPNPTPRVGRNPLPGGPATPNGIGPIYR